MQPIYDYLASRGAEIRGEHLMVHGWLIQFLPAEGPLHREALDQAVPTEVRGIKTWVMTAEHLIAISLKLGRKKDEARIERFIEIGAYNPSKLEGILKRHGLVEKWRRLRDGISGGD